jgi:NAD(P)-dependent dehydrogenase (short-subunit alcohol dehydrogenase family)
LGYAIAIALAEHGAKVALLDRLPAVVDSAQRLSSDTGVDAIGVTVDVTDPESIEAALSEVELRLSGGTILINAAGISLGTPAIDTTSVEWTTLLDVNLNGTFYTCQAFAKRAIARNTKATIVNISSMSGFVVNVPQTQAAYNTSKAAVAMLTQSLAIEWLPLGIRVNAIAPGYFASDMTRDFVRDNPEMAAEWISRVPIGRMGNPDELGELAVYLASERSSYVVGQNILIDGGYTSI